MRLTELEKVARRYCGHYGIELVVHAGWETRGVDFPSRPDGALRHWTAGPTVGVFPSLRTLLYGRPDLPGPLAQLGQDRGGGAGGRDRLHLLAAGKANHAGYGAWNGIGPGGNSLVTGLEIEWSGPGEHFPSSRRSVSEVGIAILMAVAAGTNANDACEHREWALPKGRKIDTNLDGNALRTNVASIRASVEGSPTPTPPTTPGEDEMPPQILTLRAPDGTAHKYLQRDSGLTFHLDAAGLQLNRFLGVAEPKNADGSLLVLDATWQQSMAIVNGPCMNVHARRIEEWGWHLSAAIGALNFDVDEDALARTLAPLLDDTLPSFSDADLARIAKAAADEADRRERARLGN